jgi:hypothetical protein
MQGSSRFRNSCTEGEFVESSIGRDLDVNLKSMQVDSENKENAPPYRKYLISILIDTF